MIQPKGAHPYADKFPMASEEELDELTQSIATVGLIHPIVVTPDGLVLDGRNRLAACTRAGIEPSFVEREGDDDDYKEFVIGVNTTGRRESMTVQIAAAATALILGEEKRKNGRWIRNSHSGSSSSMEAPIIKATTQAGLVLDVLGTEALEAIRDGHTTLNAAYENARTIKQREEEEEQRRIAEARDEQAREDKAGRYFDNHPEAQAWLNAKPQGAFDTMRGAYAAYMEHDREARRIEAEKRQREENERRELEEMDQREAKKITSWIAFLPSAIELKTWPRREQVLDLLDKDTREKFLHAETTILKGAEL